MRTEILQSPAFGMLRVTFEMRDDRIVAEAGAMVGHTAGVKMTTEMQGGFLAAAKRKLLGGETIFKNTFTGTKPGQELLLAPGPQGDLQSIKLRAGESFTLLSGAYVAHTGDVKIDTKWQGARSILSGTGFFMLQATGPGELFFAAYGGIEKIDVSRGVLVDNGHIVGFTEGARYELKQFGGFRSFFLGGEGVVCRFIGTGHVYVQTRNVANLVSFLTPFRPVKGSDSTKGKLFDAMKGD